jgi:hypothetical protein
MSSRHKKSKNSRGRYSSRHLSDPNYDESEDYYQAQEWPEDRGMVLFCSDLLDVLLTWH